MCWDSICEMEGPGDCMLDLPFDDEWNTHNDAFPGAWQSLTTPDSSSLTLSGFLGMMERMTLRIRRPFQQFNQQNLPDLNTIGIRNAALVLRALIQHCKILELMFTKLQSTLLNCFESVDAQTLEHMVDLFIAYANTLTEKTEARLSVFHLPADTTWNPRDRDHPKSRRVAVWVIEKYKNGILKSDISALATELKVDYNKLCWLVYKRVKRLDDLKTQVKPGRPVWAPDDMTLDQLMEAVRTNDVADIVVFPKPDK